MADDPKPGEPGGPPRGAFPGSDAGAPPAVTSSADDYLPAVEPGQTPSAHAPTSGAPPSGRKQVYWRDVEASPIYQAYTPQQKQEARYQYFDEVVKPKFPQDKWADVLHQFERDTGPKVAAQPGQPPVPAQKPAEDPTMAWTRSGMSGPPPTPGKPTEPGAADGFGPMLDKALKSVPSAVMATTGVPELEAAVHAGSGIVSAVGQAFEGLKAAYNAPPGLGAKADVEAQQKAAQELTYQPRTAAGKTLSEGVDKVIGIIPKAADRLTGGIAESGPGKDDTLAKKVLGPKGSEYLEAAANVGVQALPALLGVLGGAARTVGAEGRTLAARAAQVATDRAKSFVKDKTSLDWDEIPKGMQEKLVAVAKDTDQTALDRLKPTAIERQAAFEKANLPARRGQIERDVAQLTHEDTLSRSDSGQPLQDISSAQDTRLHQRLDDIRRRTGAKAVTRENVGTSVENALRGKADDKSGLESTSKAIWSKANYDELYEKAKQTQPNILVSPEPLYELFDKNPTVQDLGFLKGWLNKAKIKTEGEPGIDIKGDVGAALKDKARREAGGAPGKEVQIRKIPLAELDDLRKRAVDAARAHDTPGLHAGEVVKAIDKIFDQLPASATAWKKARDAFKAHKIEFEDQALVRKLTDAKSRTDPETALEKTADVFRTASVADIKNLQKTFATGGTAKTRAAGTQAWKDLQASMLDYLKEKATGRRTIPGQDEQLPFNSSFVDAFNELDKSGKIDAIFHPNQAKELRQLTNDTLSVRTQPPARISGPATAANLRAASERNAMRGITLAERASMVPKIGPVLAGGAKAVRKLVESGQATRDVRRAMTSRLDEAAEAASKKEAREQRRKRKTVRKHTLKSLQASSASHGATMQEDNKVQP